jgi:hypothetical protein
MSASGQSSETLEQPTKKLVKASSGNPLTYKQQLKQDAMLWAEFLYAEYKREKAQKGVI